MFRGSRSWLVKDLIFQGWVLREPNETERERERERYLNQCRSGLGVKAVVDRLVAERADHVGPDLAGGLEHARARDEEGGQQVRGARGGPPVLGGQNASGAGHFQTLVLQHHQQLADKVSGKTGLWSDLAGNLNRSRCQAK